MNQLKFLIGFTKAVHAAKASSETVRKKQEKALRKLLRYAYRHSEYYHDRFSEAGINEENIDRVPITDFPTTDKAEITDHYSQMVTAGGMTQQELRDFAESEACGLFRDRWHIVHSSGSTGVPHCFIYDDNAWSRLLAGGARSLFWEMSWKEILKAVTGKVNLLYVAVQGGRFGGGMMVSEAVKVLHANMMFLPMNESFKSWSQKVISFEPTVIIGYLSAVRVMTEELEKNGVNLTVKRVVTCAESLSPELREYLETYYKTTVVNYYAAAESMAMGVETDAQAGMILLDDMNYIEVEDGRMYLTNLYNYSQPLIRYRISDEIELLPPVPGKYGFSRCKMKPGREEDMMWFRDGEGRENFFHPTLLEDFGQKDLLAYQFIQKSRDSFRVDLEIAPHGDPEAISRKMQKTIHQLLDRHHLDFVKFETRVVKHIMPDPRTGKCRLCMALPEEKTR